MRDRRFWITWLRIVLALLFGYALVLVFAGSVAGDLFGALGFGPPEASDNPATREYLELPFMVLGAVLAGWSITMFRIVGGPLQRGESWAITTLAQSLTLWFVLDTGMSLVLGFPAHALFNLPFGVALATPLIALRTVANPSTISTIFATEHVGSMNRPDE